MRGTSVWKVYLINEVSDLDFEILQSVRVIEYSEFVRVCGEYACNNGNRSQLLHRPDVRELRVVERDGEIAVFEEVILEKLGIEKRIELNVEKTADINIDLRDVLSDRYLICRPVWYGVIIICQSGKKLCIS